MAPFRLRGKILLIVATLTVFIVIYPFAHRIDRNLPPCHSIIAACRARGLVTYRTESRQETYNKCIAPALTEGRIGPTIFSPEMIERCKNFVRRRQSDLNDE